MATFIENDTAEQVGKYIDDICSDPAFLCKNRELCGKQTSIYYNVQNVNNICSEMEKANECDNDFKECVVQVMNYFGESQKYISTSFVNVIVPIPNVLDNEGNNKFIRLPALSSSKKPESQEVCSVCACMNRFATSPGAGNNEYTSPGQDTCVYLETFEYYYYPLYVERVNKKLKDAPAITLGKYRILNSNIISIESEEGLGAISLYKLLTKNGISPKLTRDFITKTLYRGNKAVDKEIEIYLFRR
jgi:hypothetical protein